MEIAKQLFNDWFKFELNQEVRHKGDNKQNYSSDLGLLVLSRVLEEQKSDDGIVHFDKVYHCRMIRFSGSGDIARFKESELLSMDEYTSKKVLEDRKFEEARMHVNEFSEEVWASFGVQRGTKVHLVFEGKTDTSKVFKVSGYKSSQEGTLLTVREVGGIGSTNKEFELRNRHEFVLVPIVTPF
jgi:hypothetical protein